MGKILIFTHNDLDGVGVQILAEKYALSKGSDFESCRCSYHSINHKITESIMSTSDIEEIIIGDISINMEVAMKLDKLYQSGIPVRLRDHHETAEWLNSYPWATVSEKDGEGVNRCGTWMLSMDEDFQEIRNEMIVFITEVDNWDTWKWKSENDHYARNLNSLLQVLGSDKFCEYISNRYVFSKGCGVIISKPKDLFTDKSRIMLDTYQDHISKVAKNCEDSMWFTNLVVVPTDVKESYHFYSTGVVFCNDNISEVADIILSNNPELDILMLVSLPRKISFRTQKDLEVPLGKIAKAVTGSGGGHPQAASSVISHYQFSNIFGKLMRSLQENVEFDVVKFDKFVR